eukprot:1805886-Rhodomonas_salina.3
MAGRSDPYLLCDPRHSSSWVDRDSQHSQKFSVLMAARTLVYPFQARMYCVLSGFLILVLAQNSCLSAEAYWN